MWPMPDDAAVATSWTNGLRATVHLLEKGSGEKVILKVYRPGFMGLMLREYVATRYVASRIPIVPKVLAFRPLKRELCLSYIHGQRVLEWVLERFGGRNTVLSDFQNFHGLDTNAQVAEAFSRFLDATSEDACRLKEAIRASYSSLHQIGMLHGSSDPRNIIYDGSRVFIIDFDHARPSLAPARIERRSLMRWYGIAT